MSLTLTKKHSAIKTLSLAALFLLLSSAVPASAASYGIEVGFDARYGVHTQGPPSTATHRHSLQFDQTAKFNERWYGIIGFRAEAEAAYASNPERYAGTDVSKYDSQTFLPRDNYLQYRNGSFQTRIGYQQVVWGEAFGAYYADIVNPKDMREAGLGDLSRNRISSPLLNLQWIGGSYSIQGIYLPFPQPSLLPKNGSDFGNVPLPAEFSAYKVVMAKDPAPMPTTGEAGIRITKQIASFDFSAFYFNYHDRSPIFALTTPTAPLTLNAEAQYRPLQTGGLTMTVDFDGFLVRTEALQHLNRSVNTFSSLGLSSAKTDEFVYVIGLDLPPLAKWQFGFQYSESKLLMTPIATSGVTPTWAFREEKQQVVSARIAKTFEGDITVEALGTQFLSDRSSLLQASLNIPLADQFELVLGADNFDGTPTSQLGRFKPANRAWIMLKAFLKK